jgi:NifU-like protein involved in Fe-S cluster formation
MTMTSLVLSKHIDRPFNNRTLPVEHGRGIVADEAGANAVKIAFTLDVSERLTDVAFRSFGDPMLVGCASFLTEVLRGQTLSFARAVTSHDLARTLHLHPDEEIWSVMAVRALLRAVRDARARRPHQNLAVDIAPGVRRGGFVPPRAVPGDRAMLMPGQTLDGLLYERQCLWHALLNLDLCLQVALSDASSRPTSIEGRWPSSCSLMVLQVAVPLLPRSDRALLSRLGVQGRTVAEAGAELGLPPSDVLARVWEMARKVQTLWRGQAIRQGVRA